MNIFLCIAKIKLKTKRTLALLALPALLLGGDIAMAIEEPDFEIIETADDIEYRRYQPFVIAQTIVDTDERSKANNIGFRRLFKYITGANTGQEKIEMTAPVIQRDSASAANATKGEKIAMTAPVQQSATEAGWKVAFVLPLHFTMDSAPIPSDADVKLHQVEARTMAVLGFSGRWTDKNIRKHQDELINKLEKAGVEITGEAEFAAYNAPFRPPFMRRNEVMVEIANK
ncbi:heme-binding protein [Gammaproteobacteria bacterium]|nr:heme-binding protein [Gammaproteobacteria bacterium]